VDERSRARALGVELGLLPPGPLNALTDVAGVRVGHTTLLEDQVDPTGRPVSVRTGVTVVLPGDLDPYLERPAASAFVLNGAGELGGLAQILEWGCLETPIGLTNTFAVPVVADALVDWTLERHPGVGRGLDVVIPAVGECDDSWLNDIVGRHVRPEHVRSALDAACGGPVELGTVGAGTGMVTYGLKGGIGSSSRRIEARRGGFTVGVLVQTNFGTLADLRFGGAPVGQRLVEALGTEGAVRRHHGSVIVVLATDAPMNAHQLQRLCRRAALGIARTGAYAAHASGEIVLGFSTTHRSPRLESAPVRASLVVTDVVLDDLFRAAIEATEEAILDSLCAATTVVGRDGHRAEALPIDTLRACLAR
jgi:D-aminopeptidase